MRRLFGIALVALSLGCGSDTLGPVMTVDGQWSGTQNGYSFSANMTQSSTGAVTGTALIAGIAGGTEATIEGTFSYPTLTITVTPPALEPVHYTGTMSASEAKIFGKLNGSGFTDLEVDLVKRK